MVWINFLRNCAIYCLATLVLVLIFREDPGQVLYSAWRIALKVGSGSLRFAAILLLVGLILTILLKRDGKDAWRKDVPLALAGSIILHTSLPIVKTTMPAILPFWADPALAEADRLLHFGTDAWELAHRLAVYLPMEHILPLYLEVWGPVSLTFPLVLAALDSDVVRVARFLKLYLAGWILIGNGLALAGLSGGPVYYDRLYQTDRFPDLANALAVSPVEGSSLQRIQEGLWQLYLEGTQAFGAGISAFPSVHISISAVIALYAWERSRLLALPALFYFIGIFFISVYSGYHYALDGYVSVLVIFALWRWQKRRQNTVNAA